MTVYYRHKLSKCSRALVDVLQRWRHPVYSGHPKVLTSMFSKLNIQSGDIVLECGAGNGVGTALLARTVGAKGHVYSVDQLERSIRSVRKRLNNWQEVHKSETGTDLPSNVTLINNAVQDLDTTDVHLPKEFDLIFVDIGEPASKLITLSRKLRFGKCLAVYIPSVNRIVELLEIVKLQSLPLVLEGVWEESLNVITMHTSQQSFDDKHENRGDVEELKYGLNVSRKDEMTTAFLVKFCKVLKESSSGSLAGERTFNYGDHVILSAMQQPKKGKHRSVMVQLSIGQKFYNDWGSICLDQIIPMLPGSTIHTSTGLPVYITKPSFPEYVLHGLKNKISQRLAMFLPRFHHLLSLGADVCHGSSVLEMSAVGTSLTQHLSDTVGKEGHVYSITEDRQLILKLYENWNLSNIGRDEELSKNRTNLEIADLSHLDTSGMNMDAVILMPRTQEDANVYITHGLNLLKSGKLMSVFCTSLEHVSGVLRHNAVKHGKLIPKILYEDKDRPWIVKSPIVQNRNESDSCYYICRPKHGETGPTGYIIVLTKDKVQR